MLERALIGVFHRVGKKHIQRYVDEAAFRWNQRTARHDENGELLGFEKLPFELQLKKVLRRAPGNEIRFSDMGGICSPEERKRSEEHTSELQSLMRISYAVFCLKKKQNQTQNNHDVKTETRRQYKRSNNKTATKRHIR